jgi:hypothetical protein
MDTEQLCSQGAPVEETKEPVLLSEEERWAGKRSRLVEQSETPSKYENWIPPELRRPEDEFADL